MLNNKSKLCIGVIMSCFLITQSMAYSLDSIKSINNQSVNQYSVLFSSAIHYNANGNMSTDNKGASFSYNAANALTQVSLASGAKESEYYYANGLRAVAQNNTKVLVHYYSRNNALLNSSDGAHSSAYLIANNVVARSVNGNATVLLHNRHGSVIGQLGDKSQFYQYSVYGVQRTEDGGQKTEDRGQRTEFRGQKTDSGNGTLDLAINPLRYSGYMFDPLTGLYYLKARDYNPHLRSFIQADSYAFNNQGLINGYYYGNNNPLMGIDPSGHDWWKNNKRWFVPLISAIGGIMLIGGVGGTLGRYYKKRSNNRYTEALNTENTPNIEYGTSQQPANTDNNRRPIPEEDDVAVPESISASNSLVARDNQDAIQQDTLDIGGKTITEKKDMLNKLINSRNAALGYPIDQAAAVEFQVDILNLIAHDYPRKELNNTAEEIVFAVSAIDCEASNLMHTVDPIKDTQMWFEVIKHRDLSNNAKEMLTRQRIAKKLEDGTLKLNILYTGEY
ncbi:RHS repeat-associated core domain-containing protein [Cysteiniphilum halobium]|uniref:RHS repeat-associated core domain-containing protein n=1 Tax=Cysteiniphilum halobium TaxID=2219059 RepID=UPI000E64EFF2|nr:RHS repeat-associated core domain-containing protein [Cysteiniphilum halobium]